MIPPSFKNLARPPASCCGSTPIAVDPWESATRVLLPDHWLKMDPQIQLIDVPLIYQQNPAIGLYPPHLWNLFFVYTCVYIYIYIYICMYIYIYISCIHSVNNIHTWLFHPPTPHFRLHPRSNLASRSATFRDISWAWAPWQLWQLDDG